VVGDYKNSLYIGNRPYHISKGNILGVVPGAILGAGVAIFLSKMLADGSIDLLAPQANAFAAFTIILAEGQGDWYALGLGFLLGAFAEWATGMGTSFGLGMYLPTPVTFPMLIGGAARDWWETRRLLPKVEEIRLSEGSAASEKSRALMLLFTFMVAAGALTGEAFFGVESAIMAVSDEIEVEQEYHPDSWTEDTYLDEWLGVEDDDYEAVLAYATARNIKAFVDKNGDGIPDKPLPCVFILDAPSGEVEVTCKDPVRLHPWWPQARFAGFVVVNVALAGIIFVLFRAAGIIGLQEESEDESEVMDAELAD
jgi:hypothetical protein